MIRGETDEAYSPLEAPDILPLLSIFLFSLALAAKPLVRLLPLRLRPYPWGVMAPALLAAALAATGFALSYWSARRGGRRRGLARVGLFLNGVVLALTALAALGIFAILRH